MDQMYANMIYKYMYTTSLHRHVP